jgi:site-specific DNA-methyltransferase (cytosine-N4-specific)
LGKSYVSSIEEFLASPIASRLKGKVNLVFTSPPFPLASPKKYGNRIGVEYLEWIVSTVSGLIPLIAPDGSLVMEIGNAWDKGSPTMSTLPLKTLIAIEERTGLNLCQQFIWENSARLPGPATWVNKERIRLKDSHTHLWWFSPSLRPKADNRNVLTEYSTAMRRLIRTGKYNPGRRPSEHVIGEETFARDNKGAIHSSTIVIPQESAGEADTGHSTLIMGNTATDPGYRAWCQKMGLGLHPARMPIRLAEFFIRFLTEAGDIVLDPFGGSNTTGRAAENLGRKWVSVEMNPDYVLGSKGRFEKS